MGLKGVYGETMNKSCQGALLLMPELNLSGVAKQKAFEIRITEDKVKKAQIEAGDAIYINGRPLDKIWVKRKQPD